jgi:sodium/potassium-transporting ATPase subunit alpha
LGKEDSYIILKGAPDILLDKCSTILTPEGNEVELDLYYRSRLQNLQIEWSNMSRRVILIAKRPCKVEEISSDRYITTNLCENFVQENNDFCCLGLIGLIDPPREDISSVVNTIKNTGIRVFMITGDFQNTAVAIAKTVGIFSNENYDTIENITSKSTETTHALATSQTNQINQPTKINEKSLLLTGETMLLLTDENWKEVVKYNEIVFARVTPQQKLEIVQNFKSDKQIVAVTGDGVNDAPALRCADMGIAMGSGTDLAIEAAETVLLDNNFTSILKCITLGRLVFDNLRKVIIYAQTAGEFSEIVPVFVNIFLGVPMPLSSFLMIIICVLTDIPNELSLIEEEPETDLIKQPPRPIKNHLVNTPLMIQAYLYLGIWQCFWCHFFFFWYLNRYANLPFKDVIFAYGNWTDGYKGYTMDQLNQFNNVGQCVYFVILVMSQAFGNLWATRTLTLSLFQQNPFKKPTRNLWILVAICTSLGLMFLILYIPALNTYMGTSPVPVEFYFFGIAVGLGIFAVDEIRKLLKRHNVPVFRDTI